MGAASPVPPDRSITTKGGIHQLCDSRLFETSAIVDRPEFRLLGSDQVWLFDERRQFFVAQSKRTHLATNLILRYS